jgi:hypothetical protein
MIATPGTRCTLRAYEMTPGPDGSTPQEGDFFRTNGGSCYLIEQRRESRSAHILAVFVCTRLENNAVSFDEEGVWLWRWASRSPRKALA